MIRVYRVGCGGEVEDPGIQSENVVGGGGRDRQLFFPIPCSTGEAEDPGVRQRIRVYRVGMWWGCGR